MKKFFAFVFALALSANVHSQNDPLLEKGLKLRSENKWAEAMAFFNVLLQRDSNNVAYLHNASYCISKMGNRMETENSRQNYFRKAETFAKRAIALDAKCAEAHYVYALALGRINEFASSKQKIANAKVIKSECDQAISLNPNIDGVYHILGRWHRTIAGFNAIEKAMINTLFGGVPEGGSYDAAITSFKKAIQLKPDTKLHYFELAMTYKERDNKGDEELARQWFQKTLTIKAVDEDDVATDKKCNEYLK